MTLPENHAEQLDLLIARIADGEACDQDWSSFAFLAERSPQAWKHLAQAQRDHQALSLAVGVALHAADRVDLPSREAASAFLRNGGTEGRTFIWSRVRQSGGWAVAAVLTLALLGGYRGPFSFFSPRNSGINTAGMSIPANYFQVNSPDDALQLYRDQGKQSGRFIAEVPVLLESRPAATGKGFEVVIVRQIVERTEVSDLLRFAQDEAGRPIPVRVMVPGRAGQAE